MLEISDRLASLYDQVRSDVDSVFSLNLEIPLHGDKTPVYVFQFQVWKQGDVLDTVRRVNSILVLGNATLKAFNVLDDSHGEVAFHL